MFGCVYCYCVYLCGKFHLNKRIMNREIIFRGKRLDNDEWLYGDLMHDNQGGCYIYPLDAENLYTENKVATDTVGQFSGLVDKNGVKIFEGDWVLLEGVGIFNVRYSTSMCQFGLYGKRGFVDALKELQEDRYVVVGNVYDNPELLATK